MEYSTPLELIELLRAYCVTQGSQKAAAATLGVSGAYLNDMLHNRRGIPDGIASTLGYTKQVIYTPKEG